MDGPTADTSDTADEPPVAIGGGESDHVPLAHTPNRAGRAIGSTLGGDPTPVGPIGGIAVLKAFDLEVARTGVIDPKRARDHGFDPVSVTIEAPMRTPNECSARAW